MEMIEQAIFATVAYADVFEYPLNEAEIYRFLIGYKANREEIHRALKSNPTLNGKLSLSHGYYALSGRESTLETRLRRKEISARLWPRAIQYGHWIGSLPFVNMVAVTGSLAMDNASSTADLDYLIVTEPGRLWLARAMVILLVRLASKRGNTLCPNYFITENGLYFTDHNLFTAHEVVQMVPVVGWPVYEEMMRVNGWIKEYLPNTGSVYGETPQRNWDSRIVRPVFEQMLRSAPGNWLEQWEMRRKLRRFSRLSVEHPEARFSADICKGHFDDHGEHVQHAFADRMAALVEVIL